MAHEHNYKLTAVWTGNKGDGTKNVRTYDRSHRVSIQGKPELFLTTDNPAVGDKSKLNPEDLLVTAISSCHMLSYLYVCAMEGVVITSYTDNATGIMIEQASGGRETKCMLRFLNKQKTLRKIRTNEINSGYKHFLL